MKIDEYLQIAIEQRASDIYLIAGQPPVIRIEGKLSVISSEPLEPDLVREFIGEVASFQRQKEEVQIRKEIDVIYTFAHHRFRMNIHFQQGMPAIAIRAIPSEIPSPEFLNFPPALLDAALMTRGLILLTGAPSSGTSSVAAAMVELNNLHRSVHIVTIEDPPEFIFVPKKSVIEQREVGVDTPAFASAFQAIFRQDVDVLMIGETRDPETTALLLTAAETGCLVISIVPSPSPIVAIQRLVHSVPPRYQSQVLEQLASSLILIASRELLPAKDGGRIAAWEILVNTPAVSNLIRQNELAAIPSAIQAGARDGMVTLEQSKQALRGKGLIV